MHDYRDRSMPIGLAVMLARDNAAMRAFALMDDDAQQNVLERARRIGSRAEMNALVGSIAGGMIAPGLVGGGTDRYDDPRM